MNSLRSLGLSCVLATALLSACSSEKAPEAARETAGAPAAEVDAKPGIAVSEARLVLPAVPGRPAAVYFTLANKGDKPATLAGVHVEGAAKAEMHQTTGGQMAPVDKVDLAPGTEVKFAPGGMHVMAFELADTLKAGGKAEMTLTFADGDKASVPLSVEPAGGGAADHAMEGEMDGSMDHGDMH